jgi:hypothetical protein
MPIVQIPIQVAGRNNEYGKARLTLISGEYVSLRLEPTVEFNTLELSRNELVIEAMPRISEILAVEVAVPSGSEFITFAVLLWKDGILRVVKPDGTASRRKAVGKALEYEVVVPVRSDKTVARVPRSKGQGKSRGRGKSQPPSKKRNR